MAGHHISGVSHLEDCIYQIHKQLRRLAGSKHSRRAVFCTILMIGSLLTPIAFAPIKPVSGDSAPWINIDPTASDPAFSEDLRPGETYTFEIVVEYVLPEGESETIELYFPDTSDQGLTKEVTGTGQEEQTTITAERSVPTELNGDTFRVTALLNTEDDLASEETGYSVTTDGNPPTVERTNPSTEDPITVTKGEERQFSVTATDPDGDALTYTWSLQKIGEEYQQVAQGDQASYTHQFDVELNNGATAYRMKVEVADGDHIVKDEWLIDVRPENNDRPPSITRVSPSSEETPIRAGETKQFEVEISDLDTDYEQLVWSVDGTQIKTRNNFPADTVTTDSFEYTFEEGGSHTVTAQIVDSRGHSDSTRWGTSQPDLRVSDIEFRPSDPDPGEPTEMRLSIENTGEAAAETIESEILVDGELVAVPPTQSLDPGESVTTAWTGEYQFTESSHTVSGVVDPQNHVAETREANNRKSTQLEVSDSSEPKKLEIQNGYEINKTDKYGAGLDIGNLGEDFDAFKNAVISLQLPSGELPAFEGNYVKAASSAEVSTETHSANSHITLASQAGAGHGVSGAQGETGIQTTWSPETAGTYAISVNHTEDITVRQAHTDGGFGPTTHASGTIRNDLVVYDTTSEEIVANTTGRSWYRQTPSDKSAVKQYFGDLIVNLATLVGGEAATKAAQPLISKTSSAYGQMVAKYGIKKASKHATGKATTEVTEQALVLSTPNLNKKFERQQKLQTESFQAEEGHKYIITHLSQLRVTSSGIGGPAAVSYIDYSDSVESIRVHEPDADETPPTIGVAEKPPATTTSKSTTVGLEFDDSSTPIQYSYRVLSDGDIVSAWSNWRETSQTVTTLSPELVEGDNRIQIRAKDDEGNIQNSYTEIPVTVDTQPPEVRVEKNPAADGTNLTFISSEPVDSYTVQYKRPDDNSWRDLQLTEPIVRYNFQRPGTYDIRVRAVDEAGNTNDWSIITVENTQKTSTSTETPTATPTETSTASPTEMPTETPTASPTETQTASPTETQTASPTETPTKTPTATPDETPTETSTETPTKTSQSNQDSSVFKVIATEEGEISYEVKIRGTAEKARVSEKVHAQGNDEIHRNESDIVVIDGYTGNSGYGDAYNITGEIISFERISGNVDIRLELDDENVTDRFIGGPDDGTDSPSPTETPESDQDASVFKVIATEEGEISYEVKIRGTAEKTRVSEKVRAQGNDEIHRNGSDIVVIDGYTGNSGYGDAYNITGEIISFERISGNVDIRLELDDENITDQLTNDSQRKAASPALTRSKMQKTNQISPILAVHRLYRAQSVTRGVINTG